jgi:hypothetical protein
MNLYSVNSFDVCNALKSVANNCKLKHLKLYLRIKIDCTLLLNAINCFTELRSLELRIEKIEPTIALSFELIKNCKQLIYLCIKGDINDELFKDIDKYLPKLIYVKMESINRINDQTFTYLSNLDLLKAVVMANDNLDITGDAICNLIEKCLHFQRFLIYECPHISLRTIRVLIDTAKMRPHINFQHCFKKCAPNYYEIIASVIKSYGRLYYDKTSMELTTSDGLPLNFKITYFEDLYYYDDYNVNSRDADFQYDSDGNSM